MKMKTFKKKQDGFILLTALLILVVLILIAISASVVGSTNSIAANSSAFQKQAYQAALSGNDYLMAKINSGSDTEFNVLKSKHCTSGFDQQYTSLSTISEGSDLSKRQIDIYWYACTAVSGGKPVAPAACPPNGECLSVIISGIACPKGVAVSAKNCTIVRYLQGIVNIND